MQQAVSSGSENSGARTFALVCYILHLLGAILGLPSIIALILNYVKRHDGDPVFDSHHAWMIRSFWWALFWGLLVFASYFLIIGLVIGWIFWFLVWAWYIYRHVRGLIVMLDNRSMPY